MSNEIMLIAMTDKESIVRNSYDKIAREYDASRDKFDHRKELKEFAALLPENAKVLDVGCGAGVPVDRFLAESGFDVTGIDFSENMLGLAETNVPEARFFRKDMTRLDFEDNSFDGLVAFYSIIHVPREKHSSLFESFHNILKPEGIMLVCMGPDEWEAVGEYQGTEMFWSHYTPEKSLQLVKDAGFRIVYDRILIRGGEKHYWIMARNRK
jgi:ubiquinone/menaquinone biosynthesis C-methylase UbiE